MKKPNSKNARHEVRVTSTGQKFEIRSNADGSRTISGYAVTWQDLSRNLGGFKEKASKGCFAQSLKDNPDVMCLYGHDPNQILGRVSSGTLTIAEDSKGLRFSCKLPNTSTANDLIELMDRGDLRNMSFGFSVPQGGDDWSDVGGEVVRTLLQVTLYEISVVGDPAYTTSSVNLRSAPAAIRAKLKKDDIDFDLDLDDDDDSDDDDDDDEEDRSCNCACDACIAAHPANSADQSQRAARKQLLNFRRL